MATEGANSGAPSSEQCLAGRCWLLQLNGWGSPCKAAQDDTPREARQARVQMATSKAPYHAKQI